MAFGTYGTLKTAIANWLNRSDLNDHIPEFITLAEAMIAGDPEPLDKEQMPGIRCREMEKRVTASISSRYADLPTDFLEARNVQINASPIKRLKYLSPEQIDISYDSTDVGEPSAYTIIGSEIQLAPSPDSTYTVEIAYFARFAPLVDDGDSNWILANHPGVYLYGALLHAEPYILNDSRVLTWKAFYRNSALSLNSADKRGRFGAASLSMRPDIMSK